MPNDVWSPVGRERIWCFENRMAAHAANVLGFVRPGWSEARAKAEAQLVVQSSHLPFYALPPGWDASAVPGVGMSSTRYERFGLFGWRKRVGQRDTHLVTVDHALPNGGRLVVITTRNRTDTRDVLKSRVLENLGTAQRTFRVVGSPEEQTWERVVITISGDPVSFELARTGSVWSAQGITGAYVLDLLGTSVRADAITALVPLRGEL